SASPGTSGGPQTISPHGAPTSASATPASWPGLGARVPSANERYGRPGERGSGGAGVTESGRAGVSESGGGVDESPAPPLSRSPILPLGAAGTSGSRKG